MNRIVSSPPSEISGASIRGFASIDYRLSPHADMPQDPAVTPASQLRNAQHPDHIEDVWSALQFLVDHRGLTEDYVLIGHSAGATLTFQLLMGKDALPGRAPPPHTVPLPKAVIGIAGIYDLVGLDERHTGYTGFITSAFGSEKSDWRRSSPALYTGNFATNWPSRKLAMLAWSGQDPLVDESEIDTMSAKLSRDGVKPVIIKDLTGDHNEVWRGGVQLQRLVSHAIFILESNQ